MDGTIIGRYADGTLLVIRNDFVKTKEAKRAKQKIEQNGGKVLGGGSEPGEEESERPLITIKNTKITNMEKNKRFGIKIGVVLLTAIAVAAALWVMWPEKEETELSQSNERAYRHVEVDGRQFDYNTNLLTLLCMGIDTTDESAAQSDVIDLMVLGPGKRRKSGFCLFPVTPWFPSVSSMPVENHWDGRKGILRWRLPMDPRRRGAVC